MLLVLKENSASVRVLEKLKFQYLEQFQDEGETVLKYILHKNEYLESS